jgi:NAD(P)-dependent dehydrogenase (short-subunit alcohol dehydrogenase family)
MARDDDVVEFEREVFERAFAVNLLGPMLGVKHAIPRMLERGKGAIVNTSSLAATRGQRSFPIYGMSKAALESFTRYVAVQYSKRNIRCNAVAPASIRTPRGAEVQSEEHREKRLGDVLTPRLGEPKDIAATAVFLASDDAEYITGHTIVVDGGWSTHVI